MKEKMKEFKELNQLKKSVGLTPEQKERWKELFKELAKVVLQWLLQILSLGLTKKFKK